jgi:hypothetical protein
MQEVLMSVDALAQYSGIPADTITQWLSLPPEAIYKDTGYLSWVKKLDEKLLSNNLPAVRSIYDTGLDVLKARHGLSDTIMGAHTLGNWVLGFLKFPEQLPDLLERHASVPAGVVANALPELAIMLNSIDDDAGRAEWQRALILFSIPLMVA